MPHRRRLHALSGPQFGVHLRQLRGVLAEEGLDEEAAMELVGSELKQMQRCRAPTEGDACEGERNGAAAKEWRNHGRKMALSKEKE